MVKVKKIQRVLEDLILVNNDRIKLYEKAIRELNGNDEELQLLFTEMADQSRFFRSELHEKITVLGEEDSTEASTIEGKLNRMKMDITNIFTANSTKTILDACESVEDNTQETYTEALQDTEYLDEDSVRIIQSQRDALKDSHDLIKRYRDEQAA
jgi:uncharacterized protein (TIGR02284 family)